MAFNRLILLVHLSNMQIEKCLNSSDGQKPPSSHGLPSNLSAGLAVKKYWSKFTHLCSTSRQLYCQVFRTGDYRLPTRRFKLKFLNFTQNKALKQKDDSKPIDSTDPNSQTKKSTKSQNISDDLSNKNTQTIETAFVPCDSCAKVQTNLRKNADTLLNILHFENIPSSLAKYRSSFPSNHSIGWLSANDMTQWLNEQDKDISKLGKHLEFLSKNNEILKSRVAECETNVSKMTDNEKELRKELKDAEGVRSTMLKQYEKKLTDQKADLDHQIKQLTKTKETLESQVSTLKTTKQENEKTIDGLSRLKFCKITQNLYILNFSFTPRGPQQKARTRFRFETNRPE
jgi:hypothetical protein